MSGCADGALGGDSGGAMKKQCNWLVLSLLLLLGGCLEIDGQDVYVRYDQENDRIDAMFVYRGLFAEGGGGSSSDPMVKAIKDLTQAQESGEFVFWNNWPLSCDPSREYKAPRKALVAHLEVENGGLFTDPQGMLCAYQFVRVNKAKSFVKKLNSLIEIAMQASFVTGIPRANNYKLDDDSKENLREFLRSREKMITIEKGRIEARLPLSARDHRWLKGIIEKHFFDNMPSEVTRREAVAQRRKDGRAATDTTYADEAVSIEGTELRKEIARAPSMRFFWDNDITFQRTQELTTIGLGVAGDDEIHVTKAKDGMYDAALMTKLREDEFKIEDGLPDQELARRFESFRARDAKLPEKLAEKRR